MRAIRSTPLISILGLCAALLLPGSLRAGEETGELGPRRAAKKPGAAPQRVDPFRLGLPQAAQAVSNRLRLPARGPALPSSAEAVGTLGLGSVQRSDPAATALPPETPLPRAELEPAERSAVNRLFATVTATVADCYGAPSDGSELGFADVEATVVLDADGAVLVRRVSDLPRNAGSSAASCVAAAMQDLDLPAGLVDEPSELRYRWVFRLDPERLAARR